MTPFRTASQVEADLLALRAAAERAGLALACLFSSSDEFEAELIRERREEGVFDPPRRSWRIVRSTAMTVVLALTFLMC